MEEKKLLDFSINENMDIFVLIKSAEVRVAKNGKKFIAFNFADKSVLNSGMQLKKKSKNLKKEKLSD